MARKKKTLTFTIQSSLLAGGLLVASGGVLSGCGEIDVITNPAPQCFDEQDMDGDGASPMAEPWCGATYDCNDLDPNVYDGAPELCDGIDNDCDGDIDEGLADCSTTGQNICDETPTFDTSCETVSDCRVALKTADCCGGLMAMGVNARDLEGFETHEATCGGNMGNCACEPGALMAQDGTSGELEKVQLACVAGICQAYFPAAQ